MNSNDTNKTIMNNLFELYKDILMKLPMQLQKYAKGTPICQSSLKQDIDEAEKKIRNLGIISDTTMSDKEKILKLVSYISEELGAYNDNEQYEESEAFIEYQTRFIDLTNKLISNGITTQLEIDKAETENSESRITQEARRIDLNNKPLLPKNLYPNNKTKDSSNSYDIDIKGTGEYLNTKIQNKYVGLAKRIIAATGAILLTLIPSKFVADIISSRNRLNEQLNKEVEELTSDGYLHLARSYVAMKAGEEGLGVNVVPKDVSISYQYPYNNGWYLVEKEVNGLPYYCLYDKKDKDFDSQGLVLNISFAGDTIQLGRQSEKQDPHMVFKYQEEEIEDPITKEKVTIERKPDLDDYFEAEYFKDGYTIIVNCIKAEDYINKSESKKSIKIVKAEIKKGLKSGKINYDALKHYLKRKQQIIQGYMEEQKSSSDVWDKSAIKTVTQNDVNDSLKWPDYLKIEPTEANIWKKENNDKKTVFHLNKFKTPESKGREEK